MSRSCRNRSPSATRAPKSAVLNTRAQSNPTTLILDNGNTPRPPRVTRLTLWTNLEMFFDPKTVQNTSRQFLQRDKPPPLSRSPNKRRTCGPANQGASQHRQWDGPTSVSKCIWNNLPAGVCLNQDQGGASGVIADPCELHSWPQASQQKYPAPTLHLQQMVRTRTRSGSRLSRRRLWLKRQWVPTVSKPHED